jgi:putative peptidoglycan lipid II flippase
MGALAVGAGIFVSRVIGFVRDRAFAHYLGNEAAAGAFRAALRIPNLLQNLFGEGALSASFIPVYAKLLAEGKQAEARQVASLVLSALTLLLSLFVLLGVRFADPITAVLAPGFTSDVRALTVTLVRIMLPGVGLLVLSAWCLGVLNSHKKFFLSYAAPVVWSGAMIASLVVYGGDVMMLAWATVVGAAAQFVVQLPAALRANAGLRPTLRPDAAARRIAASFAPAVLTRGVVQISAYVDQILASYLGPAVVAGIGYAQTLYMLPVSLFGMAVSAAELPAMAGVAGGDETVRAALRARQEAGLTRIAFFVVPSAIGFLALGDVFLSTLFQTGRFGADDARDVWWILAGSSVALLASAQGRLLSSGLWALGDTKTPLRLSLLRVTLSAGFGYVATFPVRQAWGLGPMQAAAALSLGSSLAGWLELQMTRRALRRRIGPFSMGLAWTLRFAAVAAGAAVLAYGAKLAIAAFLPFPLPPWVTGGMVLGVYGATYLGGTYALGANEVRLLAGRVRSKLGL